LAATQDISLNQAAIKALERGLGMGGETVSYRKLRHLVCKPNEIDRKAWDKTLSTMDQVNPVDWK
jgi:hypothetical protein